MSELQIDGYQIDSISGLLETVATVEGLWGECRVEDQRRIRNVYLAGPMRGIPEYNFPEFHRATKILRDRGLNVHSPAEKDNEAGFNEKVDAVGPLLHLDIIHRDLEGVLSSDAVIVLEGWLDSVGAQAEIAAAVWAGIPVIGVVLTDDDKPIFYPIRVKLQLDGTPSDREVRASYWQHIAKKQLNELDSTDVVVEGPELDEGEDDCVACQNCPSCNCDEEDDCDDSWIVECGDECPECAGCVCTEEDEEEGDERATAEDIQDVIDALNRAAKKVKAATEEDILEEALRITSGDRNVQYGDPLLDFKRTAALWSAQFGRTFAPHEVAIAQILLKCSRLGWSPKKRDNWVDVAGYSRCGHRCAEHE